MKKTHAHVGIIMGSDSDLPIMSKAAAVLEELGIGFDITIASAHRTPADVGEYARTARARGMQVIIAGAGMAAALPGVVAAETTLPVIGVPIKSSLDGLDALLAIAQMPPGIPVATVAIDGAKNAGVLAAQIIGVHDEGVAQRLAAFKETMANEVRTKAQKLQEVGYKNYSK